MMATVLSGDSLRRPTTAEIADDIVGVLRPSEGNWTGPAASLCGFGPTLVGVDPSGVGVCSDLVSPWKASNPSPLMPLIVDPSKPYTGPIITLFGGIALPLMPLIVDPSQPYTGPIIDLMGGGASPPMPFITDPNQPYDGPVIKLVNFHGVSSLWDSGESEARTDWSSICPITFCENDMHFSGPLPATTASQRNTDTMVRMVRPSSNPTTGTDSDGRPNEGDRRQIYGVWNTWTKLPDGQHGWISDGEKTAMRPDGSYYIVSPDGQRCNTGKAGPEWRAEFGLPLLVLSDEPVEIRL